MLRNARSPLTVVTRRLSTPATHVRAATTASVSREPSTSAQRTPPTTQVRQASKPWKGKEKEKSNNVRTDSKAGKRLLSAYELGQRLAKKCQEGSLDEAIDMLKNMPLDAQNTANWNSLMKQAGNVGRYQLAYQLYIEASP